MTYKIVEEENAHGVLLELSENVTGQDIIEINQKISGCLEYSYQLFNFTNVLSLVISPEELHMYCNTGSLDTQRL